MRRLALIRHGHTAWNRAGRLQGRTDIPLDDEARAELAALRLPVPWDVAQLWSSPLARARETASLVAGRQALVDDALTEMNWGAWEGLKGVDLAADPDSGFRHIEEWGWDYRAPGGESPADVASRLAPWLAGLRSDALAVCHIGIMRILLAQAHGWDFSGPPPFRVGRRKLYVLALDDNGSLRPADPPIVRLLPRS